MKHLTEMKPGETLHLRSGRDLKVEESTRWADLKKLLSYTGDIATLTETGEIVEGVTVYETPGIFTVDV